MAFRSQRVVPGRGGGSLPDRTHLEKALGERLQYAAACCLLSNLGDSSQASGTIFKLMAEMVPQKVG